MRTRFGPTGYARVLLCLVLALTACTSGPIGGPEHEDTPAPVEGPPGFVEGRVRVIHADPGHTGLGAAVVYLDRRPGDPPKVWAERPSLVFDGAGHLSPSLVAATVGQEIQVTLKGGVLHEPFAINAAGVRLDVPTDESGGVLRLAESGVFRVYCSLHRSERSLVYASASPYVSPVDEDGRYGIFDVPAGPYRLVLWSEVVSGPIRSIEVQSGSRLRSPIWIDARMVPR